MSEATALPSKGGQIHDLGYKRYVGTRRPPSTRWRVIMRHQVAMTWKTWWRFKSALGLAVITSVVAGALMYISTNKIFQSFGGPGDLALTFANGVLPLSISWYCRAAFLVSLTVSAGVIAGDMQSGAFTFYFARSVRPIDYVLGKLAGLGLLIATLVMAGPLLLAGLRLGLSDSTSQLVDNLVIIPKALAIGALATVTYAAVPLGFSALIGNRRYALALWAAYYLVGGTIAQAIGFVSSSSIAALDLPTAIQTVAFDLFDIHVLRGHHAEVSMTAAITSILLHAGGAIAIVWYQVSDAQKTGVGGSS